MKIRRSYVLCAFLSLMVLLTYSFPFSSYLRIFCVCAIAFYSYISHIGVRLNAKSIYISCYLAFAVWGCLSYFWASYPEGVRAQMFNMLVAVLSNVVLTILISSNHQDSDGVLKWLFPVMILYLVEAVFVGYFNETGRFSANGAVNQFGMSTSYVYLITLYGAKKKKIPPKLAYGLIGLAAILTVLAGSRKALMNLVLFTCMILVFEKYNKYFLKNLVRVFEVIAVIAIFLGAVLYFEPLYNVIGKRIASLIAFFSGDVGEDLSALRRSYMKDDAIELFLKHPIIGIGLNNFKYVARYGTYAHSNLYEILCCLGIVGEVLYYVPFVIVLVLSFFQWKRNEPDAIIPFAIFFSMLITEFSNVSYIYGIIHVFLGIASGILFTNQRRHKRVKGKTQAEPADHLQRTGDRQ